MNTETQGAGTAGAPGTNVDTGTAPVIDATTGTPAADATGTPAADASGTPAADATGTPAADATGTPAADAQGEADKAAEAIANKVDLTAFTTEFYDSGDLKPESITALKELLGPLGISEAFVDQYVAGAKLTAAAETAAAEAVWEPYGGKEGAQSLVDWALDNIPEADFARLKPALENTADPEKALLAVETIRLRKDAYDGQLQRSAPGAKQPKLMPTGGAGGTTTGAFANNAEMTAAMRDPRYGKDNAYTQQVQARLFA